MCPTLDPHPGGRTKRTRPGSILFLHWRGIGGLVVLGGILGSVEAQEALNISLAGEKAAQLRRLTLEQAAATTQWGNLRMAFHGRLFTELNDNVTLVPTHSLSDIIFRAEAGVESRLPISSRNQLELSFAGGFSKYVQHPEFDRPYVLPGSRVGFDLYLTPFRITFEDSFTYQQDSVERAVVTGTARFGGFQNLGGLSVLHDANRLKTTLSYHHLLFLSATAGFRHLDRHSHLIVGRMEGVVHPTVSLGLETGMTPTAYEHSFLRDNLSISGGGFARWTLSRHSTLEAHLGVVSFQYASAGAFGPASDITSSYFSVNFGERLRKSLTLHCQIGRDSTLGVNNDQVNLWHAQPYLDWAYRSGGSLQIGLQFEHGQEIGSRQGEKFDRWGLNCGTTWHVTKHSTGGIHYSFINRSSEASSREYANHRLTLDLGF